MTARTHLVKRLFLQTWLGDIQPGMILTDQDGVTLLLLLKIYTFLRNILLWIDIILFLMALLNFFSIEIPDHILESRQNTSGSSGFGSKIVTLAKRESHAPKYLLKWRFCLGTRLNCDNGGARSQSGCQRC